MTGDSDSGAIRILCVDDEPNNLLSLEAALSGYGYELTLAESGPRALEALERGDFAVVLLDVRMPVMDGYETARIIHSRPGSRATPIVFLTAAHPSEELAIRGYQAGAVDYLFKPLNPDVLRAKVAVFAELFRKRIEISRQAELLRVASERRHANLVEKIHQGIVWSADADSRLLTYIGGEVARLTGYDKESWMTGPRLWESCIPKEDLPLWRAAIQEASASGGKSRIDHRVVRRDGQLAWFHTELHLEKLDGRTEIQGLSLDITYLKQTETALRQAIEVRDEAIRVREDFLSVASHELKTPITPLQLQLQGFMRMIDSGRLGSTPLPQIREMLELSDAQVNRLTRLIGRLLDAGRIKDGRLKLTPETVELSALVREVVHQLKYDIELSDCAVTLDLEDGIRGHWDRLRIEQVLTNLMTNATKYGAGKAIDIRLRSHGGIAELSIQDRGIGIAPEDHVRIFDRFERSVTSKNFGGLGLGLYIVKEILEMHRGSIAVESAPGQGSTFTVTLPAGLPDTETDADGKILLGTPAPGA